MLNTCYFSLSELCMYVFIYFYNEEFELSPGDL